MKSSIFITAVSAMLATASPLRKRVIVTEWVEDIVTVTVTAGVSPTGAVYVQNTPPVKTYAPSPAVSLGHAEKPQPVYTSSKIRPPPPPTHKPVYAPPPAPKPTYQAPPPAPKPSYQAPPPAPKPTQQAPPPAPKPSPPAPKPAPPAPAPSPPQSAPSSALGDYETTMVNQHNLHRANHSAPDLAWDDTLAGYAKTIATGCVFAHDMTQGTGHYGQNLASWGSTGDISDLQVKAAAQGVTMQWYNDEMGNWDFYGEDNPPADSNLELWGHFTQVVWKGSNKVGCYTANCPAGTVLEFPSWYTVCNYGPPGNFGGEYGDNVLRPKGESILTI